jgi:hypothetical protein
MTSRPQKNPVTANAEHELARFLQAVDEFECRSDETQFDQTVRNLTTPHDENDRPHVMPVRCDECYLKTELVLEGNHHVELFPASAQGCRHLPVETCPNLKAAFVRARDSRQSK